MNKRENKKKLNIRERKFIKAVVSGETPTEAMRIAGYKETTARFKSGAKLTKVMPTIQQLMEKRGLTDDYLLQVAEEGLKATKVISANIIAKSGESMADANSMTKDFIDVEDYAVRHKYLETSLKVKGHMKEKVDLNLSGTITVKVKGRE